MEDESGGESPGDRVCVDAVVIECIPDVAVEVVSEPGTRALAGVVDVDAGDALVQSGDARMRQSHTSGCGTGARAIGCGFACIWTCSGSRLEGRKQSASEVMGPGVIRQKGHSREICGGDAVAPDAKAHCTGRGRVQETGGCMGGEAEQVDAVDDGHREGDEEEEEERDERETGRYEPQHPGSARAAVLAQRGIIAWQEIARAWDISMGPQTIVTLVASTLR